MSANDTLFQIDKATGLHIPGAVVTIDSFATTGLYDIDELAVSSYDNTLYGVANNSGGNDRLVSIDGITGAVVQVMDLAGLGVPDMEGLAYDNAGTLMGTDGEGAPNGDLWEIDIAGNSITHLADLPRRRLRVAGLSHRRPEHHHHILRHERRRLTRRRRHRRRLGHRAALPRLLSSGEIDNDVDAGMYADASIGDFVWDDADADGIQDPGETGLAGITTNLLDTGGTTLASTTTAGDGSYAFAGLTPGGYRVEFVAPAGLVSSPIDQGGNEALDSDADPITGRTGIVLLSSGSTVTDVDAGMFAGALIGDQVWDDTDGDGDDVQNPGEPGIPGVTVNLYDGGGTLVATALTDGSGLYGFPVVPGTYTVEFVPPVGMVLTRAAQGGDDALDSDADAVTGRAAPITVTSGDTIDTIDAGMFTPASVGDTVFFDLDEDSTQDPGEPGIGGITVELRDSGATLIGTTTTDPNGRYLFDGLPPDDYEVTAIPPTGLANTTTNPQVHTPSSGDAVDTADFGFIGTGQLGQLVWFDTDGDGVRDPGEEGIDGAQVELVWAGVDGIHGTPDDVTFTTTTVDGAYLFTGLPPGTYRVTVSETSLPAGAGVTFSPDGGTDLVAVISLALGQSITDANFAITTTEPLAFTGLYADRLVMFAIFLLVGGETLMWAAKTRQT